MNIERIDLVDADHVATGTASFLAQAIEAKQPAQPGELTRKWFETAMKNGVESEELWSRILSDRAATEARVREEMGERVGAKIEELRRTNEELRMWRDKWEVLGIEADQLRATIADLEKRLENAVELPRPEKWPEWAIEARVTYFGNPGPGWTEREYKTIFHMPRPVPAEPTPEQMAEAIVGHHMKTSPELGETKDHDTVLADGWAKLARDLLSGKSIETLYAKTMGKKE